MTDYKVLITPQTFWQQFEAEAQELHEQVIGGSALVAYSRIHELLREANYPFIHEVSSVEDKAVLVFTPESDPRIAIIVDWFVSVAPLVPNWVLYNRRQPKPLAHALSLTKSAFRIDLQSPLFLDFECTDCLAIEIYTSAQKDQGGGSRGAAQFFLEHLIGEETVIQLRLVGSLEPLPSNKTGLMNADEFVQFCRKMMVEGVGAGEE